MSAIRLEKFIQPLHHNIGARLISESEIEAIRKESFEAGIREGAAAATEAFSTEKSRCLSRIEEVIGDAFFAREEAHRLALTSLRPLIVALVEVLAPALGRSGLSAEIAAVVEHAARNAAESSLTVFTPAGMGDEIADLLAKGDSSVQVIEDLTLAESQSRISWNGGFDSIDLGAAAEASRTAIDLFFNELEQPIGAEVKHGI